MKRKSFESCKNKIKNNILVIKNTLYLNKFKKLIKVRKCPYFSKNIIEVS